MKKLPFLFKLNHSNMGLNVDYGIMVLSMGFKNYQRSIVHLFLLFNLIVKRRIKVIGNVRISLIDLFAIDFKLLKQTVR
jgi:hypothetical protein